MRNIILIAVSAVLCLCSSIHAQESLSKWQSQPISIDGDASDWKSIPRFFDSESNVQYEFRNDAQNLYMILRTTDRATQIQLLRAGFSIHLKVKSNPPSKCGITFMPPKMHGMPPMGMNQDGNQDKLVDKFSSKPEFIVKDSAVLDGFLFTNGIITSENKDTKGICFAKSKTSRDQVIFELQVPLREIFGTDFTVENISKIPIQFQVVVNDLSESANRSHGKMSGGMRGGGMRGGGRRGGGGGSEMGGGMSRGGGEEMGGGEMGERPEMEQGERHQGMSMTRKSFSTNFKLSSGE
jgi:hypothetical protein